MEGTSSTSTAYLGTLRESILDDVLGDGSGSDDDEESVVHHHAKEDSLFSGKLSEMFSNTTGVSSTPQSSTFQSVAKLSQPRSNPNPNPNT